MAVTLVRVTVVAAVMVAMGPVAEAAASTRTATRTSSPTSYVALGDSYTSGPGIANQLGPTTTPRAPSACLRSSDNYPSITADTLGLDLTDVSCASATTGALTSSQSPGVPPQVAALSPSTSIVTVGIGGNDLGYSTIAENCVAYTPWGPTKVGRRCQTYYTAGGVDQLAVKAHQVGVKVATALVDINKRAPRARVFVVGYPDIVPPTGSGCWPALPFTASDVAYLRGVEASLNSALRAAARSAGDIFVDMATPSRTHSACASSGTRWVEPALTKSGTYPLHPDAVGMAGMAQVLTAAIRSTGPT